MRFNRMRCILIEVPRNVNRIRFNRSLTFDSARRSDAAGSNENRWIRNRQNGPSHARIKRWKYAWLTGGQHLHNAHAPSRHASEEVRDEQRVNAVRRSAR